ncbi:MAG: MFS transporter [Lachnospiraceae bacterium]
MKKTLWTKNFVLLTTATILGAAGGIASSFALSFLVFDETGSTFASALLIAIQLIPNFLLPLFAAPLMDRFPRKPFLVAGDAINGILFALAGLYLLHFDFSYTGYIFFSLLLASLNSFDSLAYNSIYPQLIEEGFEQKGYTISGMVYPVITVIMTPVAALLFDTIGVAAILLIQSVLSFLAALIESRIRLQEEKHTDNSFSIKQWKQDITEALSYLKHEKGILNIYSYMAVTNGVGNGYSPILVAFFRTTPGFSIAMYSFFSVMEFAGRSLGGLVHYNLKIPPQKRYSFAYFVYLAYETMDILLLWLPYPLMLLNRSLCGFLGMNSATMRQAAVQRYIPDRLRAKLNAFYSMLISFACCIFSLVIGAIGEILDYRLCLTLCAGFSLFVCICTIGRHKKEISQVYENCKPEAQAECTP